MIEALLVTACLNAGEPSTWPISLATSGESLVWQSPSGVRTDATLYESDFTLTSVSVVVSYFGFEYGPIDVTDQIPELSFTGSADGPCPVNFGTVSIVEPPPPDPITIGFDLTTVISGSGTVLLNVNNIVLGTATVNLPIFGDVTVDLVEFIANGQLTIDPIGTFCSSDINGDGLVGASDLLAVLAAWGSNDSSADLDADGLVGASDILILLSDWGPCA